jgi:hypothetical protein
MTASPPFMVGDRYAVGCVAFDNMEVGIGDSQFRPGPNECRDAMSRGERLLDQRNAGGASGAEDAQFHRSPHRARARGARELSGSEASPPLILGAAVAAWATAGRRDYGASFTQTTAEADARMGSGKGAQV